MVIVAQKNHHTKFFQPGSPDNVPPGELLLQNFELVHYFIYNVGFLPS